MGAKENYVKSKSRNLRSARTFKSHLKRGYSMPDGDVYVHYSSANFKPRTNISTIDTAIKSAYLTAANRVRKIASDYMGETEEQAAIIIEQVRTAIEGDISLGEGSNLSSTKRKKLDNMSFSELSTAASKASEKLTYDANQLAKFNEEIKEIIKLVANISPDKMAEVANVAEKALKETPQDKLLKNQVGGLFQFTKVRRKNTFWFEDAKKTYSSKFALIPKSDKANTSLLRLIVAYKRLEQIRTSDPEAHRAEAMHIISKLGGLVNTVGSSCVELMIANAIQVGSLTAQEAFSDWAKSFVKDPKKEGISIEISPAGEGTGKMESKDMSDYLRKHKEHMSNPEKSFVNKSDVNIALKKTSNGGEELIVNIGLNIKDYKPRSGSINPHFLGGANYKDYLIRSEVYRTELEYDLINLIGQKFSKASVQKGKKGKLEYAFDETFSKDNYVAIKSLIAARSALMAIVGLQDKKDASYLVVFSNKVVTTYDLFTRMANEEGMRLKLDIKNEDIILPYVSNQMFVETPANQITDAFTRSRLALNAIYSNFKVGVSSKYFVGKD